MTDIYLTNERAQALLAALAPLQPMLLQQKENILIVTEMGTDDIFVYCSLAMRAYVPSKFNGSKIVFRDYDGAETQLKLNTIIK